jgi:CcmD family protein
MNEELLNNAPAGDAPADAQTEESAQNVGTTEAPGKPEPDFQKEEVPGGPLMLAAYLALWVILFLFVFWTRKSQESLRSEIEALEEALDAGVSNTTTE